MAKRRLVDHDRVLRDMQRAVTAAGGQESFAELVGCSQAAVSMAERGLRRVPRVAIKALGYEPVLGYRRVD